MDKMAACRHCGSKLHELPATEGPLWADADGFTVCIKAAMPPPDDKVGLPDYVYHEPMPKGFRGAPGTIR